MCNYLVHVIQPHHPALIFVLIFDAPLQSVLRTGQLEGQLMAVIQLFEDKRAMELKNDAGKRLVYEIMKLLFPPMYTNIRV